MSVKFCAAIVVGCSLLSVSAATAATNLLVNPSNEADLVLGEIPGWTEVVGINWTQRGGAPAPQDGSFTFFPGVASSATLQQIVDVSSFATEIDAGTQEFTFSGYRQSFPQSPADDGAFGLDFLSIAGVAISSILSASSATTTSWDFYTNTFFAPVGTRSIAVNLIAERNNGSNNDANFDNLSLTAVAPAPVPVPASAVLLSGALGLAGFWGRRKKAS